MIDAAAEVAADAVVHPSADVERGARIGPATRVWHQAQVRVGATLGARCIIGKGAFVDLGVRVGDAVKIQNHASIYHGATLEDGVFVGPGAIVANDLAPRAITPDGRLKSDSDWEVGEVLIRRGASLGAGAIVLPGVTIGRWAMIAAGAVVTADVPDHGLVVGVPARLVGHVCACGARLARAGDSTGRCPRCRAEVALA